MNLEWQPAGNLSAIVSLRNGSESPWSDSFRVVSAKNRSEFVERAMARFPGFDRYELERRLEEIAAEVFRIAGEKRQERGEPEPSGLGLYQPDPWPDPVDGAELLEDLRATVHRFVVLGRHEGAAVALWILLAHTHEAWDVLPFLVAKSATKRCGKTRLICDVLSRLVTRPLVASLASASAVFRVYQECTPTLLMDEADRWLRDGHPDLIAILDAAHTRSGAYVLKSVPQGDDWITKQFPVFGPKAIGAIGSFADTLQDRSIIINLKRKAKHEHIERWRERKGAQLVPLCRKAARWAQDNLDRLRESEPEPPGLASDRAEDNWSGLLAIADLAGGRWPQVARDAARALTDSEATDDETGVLLLADLQALFDTRGVDRMSSALICESLADDENRPWGEWGRKRKPITPNALARLLRPFGVTPRTVRLAEGTPKGYTLEDLQDSFSRYIPPPNRHNATSRELQENPEPVEGEKNLVVDRTATSQPSESQEDLFICGGVADRTRGTGEEKRNSPPYLPPADSEKKVVVDDRTEQEVFEP